MPGMTPRSSCLPALLRSLPFAVATLVTAPANAQATLTVGAGGYAEIADAIAAAQPGDQILVEPGAYQPFDLTIGVRIVAPAGATAVGAMGAMFSRQISVPAGQRAEIVGLGFRSFSTFPPAIWPVNLTISGHVAFADCTFSAINADFSMPLTVCNGDIQFDRCTFEALDDCVVVSGGHVQLNECKLTGSGQSYNPPPARAIRAGGGQVDVFSCELRGANSAQNFCDGSEAIQLTGQARLRLRDSTVIGGSGDPFFFGCLGASGIANYTAFPVQYVRSQIAGGLDATGVQQPPISGSEQLTPLTGGFGPPAPGFGPFGGPRVGAAYTATVIAPSSSLAAVALSFERTLATVVPSIAQPVHFDPVDVILFSWGIAATPLPAWPGFGTFEVQTAPLTPAMADLEFWLHPLVWDGAQFQAGPTLGGVVK